MRKAHIISIIAILFFFEGCSIVSGSKKGRLWSITPSKNNFIAVLDTPISHYDSRTIVSIDSDGALRHLYKLDPLVSEAIVSIINDSVLLLRESYQDPNLYPHKNKFVCYNLNTRKDIDSFPASSLRTISNDRRFLTINYIQDRKTYAELYELNGNKLIKKGSVHWPRYLIGNSGVDKILVRLDSIAGKDYVCLADADLSILDTLPKIFYGSIAKGDDSTAIIYIVSNANKVTHFLRYELQKKIFDTLFIGHDHYEGPVFHLDSDHYLFKFLTSTEYADGWRDIYEGMGGSFCATTSLTPKCYWVIGNIRTKKLEKIGYMEFDAKVNSTKDNILFFKQDAYEYRVKVLSVKELIDGM